MTISIWRLQTITGPDNSIRIDRYCLENNVAAMGWSLDTIPQESRQTIEGDFEEYERLSRIQYPDAKKPVNDNVRRLAKEIQPNDLIWMRCAGQYYIARVGEDSDWYFDAGDEATKNDASCQRRNLTWHVVGEEDKVPGAINTGFYRGATLQRIRKDAIVEYSQLAFNKAAKGTEEKQYPEPGLQLSERNFYNLLQPDDVEDLLCMWLNQTEGYICIPSTKKIATELYEYTLVDPRSNPPRYCYPQVKKGNIRLNAEDYKSLNGEVYLLTTEGEVDHGDDYENIHVVDPAKLYEFAIDEKNRNFVPPSIQTWTDFLSKRTPTDSEA